MKWGIYVFAIIVVGMICSVSIVYLANYQEINNQETNNQNKKTEESLLLIKVLDNPVIIYDDKALFNVGVYSHNAAPIGITAKIDVGKLPINIYVPYLNVYADNEKIKTWKEVGIYNKYASGLLGVGKTYLYYNNKSYKYVLPKNGYHFIPVYIQAYGKIPNKFIIYLEFAYIDSDGNTNIHASPVGVKVK